jgi:hypothetical protein
MTYQDNNRFAHVSSSRLSEAVAQITGKSIAIQKPKRAPKTKKKKASVSTATVQA